MKTFFDQPANEQPLILLADVRHVGDVDGYAPLGAEPPDLVDHAAQGTLSL